MNFRNYIGFRRFNLSAILFIYRKNFGELTYHFEVWVNAIKRHELSHTEIKFIFADIFQP